jgi:hypothetical protein
MTLREVIAIVALIGSVISAGAGEMLFKLESNGRNCNAGQYCIHLVIPRTSGDQLYADH